VKEIIKIKVGQELVDIYHKTEAYKRTAQLLTKCLPLGIMFIPKQLFKAERGMSKFWQVFNKKYPQYANVQLRLAMLNGDLHVISATEEKEQLGEIGEKFKKIMEQMN
jgi:hypothetical protein